jgi:hypothetical protein
LKFRLFVAIATRIFNKGRKEKVVHNLQTAIYPYFKFHKNIFSVPFKLSLDPVYVLILPYFQTICCHSNQNVQHRKKKKDVHNLHTAIYPYIKFHKNIFSTFCVIAGSSFVDGRTDGLTDRWTDGQTDGRRVNLKSPPVKPVGD